MALHLCIKCHVNYCEPGYAICAVCLDQNKYHAPHVDSWVYIPMRGNFDSFDSRQFTGRLSIDRQLEMEENARRKAQGRPTVAEERQAWHDAQDKIKISHKRGRRPHPATMEIINMLQEHIPIAVIEYKTRACRPTIKKIANRNGIEYDRPGRGRRKSVQVIE
jgi:hypothetical protein